MSIAREQPMTRRPLRSNFEPGTTREVVRRAQWRALGLSDADLEKPKIAVVNSSSELASGEYRDKHVDIEDVFMGSVQAQFGKLDRAELREMANNAIRGPGAANSAAMFEYARRSGGRIVQTAVESGVDVAAHTIELAVDAATLDARRVRLGAPALKPSTGWLGIYRREVQPMAKGVVLVREPPR